MLQAWVSRLEKDKLAASYVKVIFANLSGMLGAAVDDGLIARNPCRAGSIRLPKENRPRVQPWSSERVLSVVGALPDAYACMAVIGAGCGLRQGEIFGLAVGDIDFLRGVVHVRRQVKHVSKRLVFALPKGQKERDVPLPSKIGEAVAAHLAARPARAVTVTLPWAVPDGKPVTVDLLFTSRETKAVNRNYFNTYVWKPALAKAGVIEAKPEGEKYGEARSYGMHAFRHHYASVLLDAGESVKALSEYLGHSDSGFTLRTYTHLMPASEERTKKAVGRALSAAVDGLASRNILGECPRCTPGSSLEGLAAGQRYLRPRCRSTARTRAGAGGVGWGRFPWCACSRSRSR
ncbi:tyrosine-type recombinase/integrase [Streptomyces lushanensis]|uniref:tyrosine-type recombinase/integrase n=1 Tax=Streptomyces lushanensis TaxID=1434255 RepID=UPI00099F61B5|nr:site-specific integrase [Streptomyces lushanensis]